ncbi:MAG: trypsin-like peptidase domain-containing protein [Phenylobacterium sp.]|uniref:S1 family peptidase n=1 Tax=Phenylobacterium sp. TaxID=1871053 RepID=UPI001A571EC0|nr:serine protease [Phenylobacterium sp.]MBL8770092.1 trypsin-like peptidase domain-containing protein [Phenylobacterium sp.]
MKFPRLPDWVVYAAIIVVVLAAALGRNERTDAPPPPPKSADPLGEALGPASPFDPAIVVDVPDRPGPAAGTAFSIARSGVWLTARHVVDGCRRVALVVGPGTGVAVTVRIDPKGEAALLYTEGGAAPLPLALSEPLRRGQRAFHPGFPQGEPGEASSRLLGRENLVVRGHGARTEPVLVWAETGRTEGLNGTLGGLSGAPALDAQGRVLGVTIAESPRRGRIYTTAPEIVSATLTTAGRRADASAASEVITPQNYFYVADDLRRELQVAQVVCLEN